MKLSETLNDIGRPIAYFPKLRQITGSTTATILFCQLFYWNDKTVDGWVYKTSQELEEETGLSYKEQKTARRHLVNNGLLEEKHKRLEHKIYFKLDIEKLDQKWGVRESTNGTFGKVPMGFSYNNETETTSYKEKKYKKRKKTFVSSKTETTTPTSVGSLLAKRKKRQQKKTSNFSFTRKPVRGGDFSDNEVDLNPLDDYQLWDIANSFPLPVALVREKYKVVMEWADEGKLKDGVTFTLKNWLRRDINEGKIWTIEDSWMDMDVLKMDHPDRKKALRYMIDCQKKDGFI
jgi:hypothetical protein